MYRTYFWNKLHIYGKKIIFIFTLLLFFFTQEGKAQAYTWDANLPNYDDRKLHYGFILALNSTRFRPDLSSTYIGDTISSIQSPAAMGFTLGFIVNYKLTDYLDLRLTPGVSFYERTVNYNFASGFSKSQTQENVFIELPLLLKYKSQRRKNTRLYMIGGLKTAFEAGAKKNQRQKSDLRTNSFDLSIDYGFGFDFYFKFFKFAPELRFSHGIMNLLINDPNVYSHSLIGLTSHTVTLYLNFE